MDNIPPDMNQIVFQVNIFPAKAERFVSPHAGLHQQTHLRFESWPQTGEDMGHTDRWAQLKHQAALRVVQQKGLLSTEGGAGKVFSFLKRCVKTRLYCQFIF